MAAPPTALSSIVPSVPMASTGPMTGMTPAMMPAPTAAPAAAPVAAPIARMARWEHSNGLAPGGSA